MNHLTPILQAALDAVIEHADRCGLPGWCRTGIVAGAAAWDVCCDCEDGSGQLWVRLIDMQPDEDVEDTGPFGCDRPARLTVGVGSLRCVPIVNENGEVPSAVEDQDAAELIQYDAQILKDAVMCAVEERWWVSWQALDNLGGCGGGEHIFQFPFVGCFCGECDDSPMESPGGSP